jgi:hypothetical protein
MPDTLHQTITDQACDVAKDYTPCCDKFSLATYYGAGFVKGAEWFQVNHQLHELRMWTIEVIAGVAGEPRHTYTVPATSERDARLMAFILDRGFEDVKYGSGSVIERGELELALVYTEVVKSSGA